MADVEEDRISITITADGADAGKAFDDVLEKLSDLESRVGGADRVLQSFGDGLDAKLGSVASSLESLARSGSGLDGFTERVSGVVDGMRALGEVDPSVAQGAAGTIRSLTDSLGRLPEVASSLTALSDGLRRIPAALSGFAGITRGSDSLRGFRSAIGSMTRTLETFSPEARKGASAVRALGDGMSALNRAGSDATSLNRNLSASDAALKAFVSDLNEFASSNDISAFYRLADAVDKVASSYGRLGAAQRAVGRASGTGVTGAASSAGKALSTVQAIGGRAGDVLSKAWGAATSAARQYASTIAGIVSMPVDSIRDRIDGIVHGLSRIGSMATSAVFYNGLFSALRAGLDGVTTGIQNLYQWTLIMGNSFVGTMDSCATSLLYLQNSIGGAASELLDALAPAFETVINYAVAAVNAVNQLIAALTGHSTWRRARRAQTQFAQAATTAADASEDAADSASSNADATDDETKAEKKYQNTVLGFDELNKLNEEPKDADTAKKQKTKKAKTPKSGSGGVATPDYGSMFEDVPVDDYFKDLADTDDWTKLGADIAEALNNWEKQIDWDAIDATAAKWSKRVWTALNGFVRARDWASLGYTIGRGLNVGLHFIDDIIQNTAWDEYGAGIASALNHAIATIDWVALGHVMTDGLKVALEFLHGFMNGANGNDTYEKFNFDALRDKLNVAIDAAFDNIDWQTALTDLTDFFGEVGLTIVSGFNRIAQNIDEQVQRTDWTGWGAQVAGYLARAVQTIDWPNLGRLLTDGLKVMFEGLHGFLDESEANGFWTDLGNGIEAAITSAFNNIDWAQTGMDINRLANHLLDVVEQAIGAINWDDVNTFITNLNIPQLLWRALQDIAKGIGDLLVNSLENGTWPLIVAWIVGKGVGLASKVGEVLKNLGMDGGILSSASGSGATIGQCFGAAIGVGIAFDGIRRNIDEGFSVQSFGEVVGGAALTGASIGAAFGHPIIGAGIGAAVGLAEQFIQNVDWQSIGDALSKVPEKAKEAFDKIPGAISDALSSAAQNLSDWWESKVKPFWDGVGQSLHDFFLGTTADAKEANDQAEQDADETHQSMGDKLAQWLSDRAADISGFFSNLDVGALLQTVADTVSEKLGGVRDAVVQWFSDRKADVEGFFSNVDWGGLLDAVASTVSDKLNDIKDAVTGWFSDRLEDIGDFFGSIDIGKAFDDIKSAVSDGLSDLKDSITGWFTGRLKDIGDFFSNAWGKVKDFFTGSNKTTEDGMGKEKQTVDNGLGDQEKSLTQWLSDRGGDLASWFKDRLSDAGGFFSDAGGKLRDGLTDGTGKVRDFVSDIGGKLSDLVDDGLSKAHDFGENFAGGVDDKAGDIEGSVRDIIDGVTGRIMDLVNAMYGHGSDAIGDFSNGIGSMLWRSNDCAQGIANGVSQILALANSAYSWGSDLVANFANGISRGLGWVSDAANGIANAARSILHFSTPDEGPLKDFDTYAPDMMREFAGGIERYKYLVTDSLTGLAGEMSGDIQAPIISASDLTAEGTEFANAVTLGVIGGTQPVSRSGGSGDRPITLVLRIGNEDIARATYRGLESLADRGVITPEFM